MPMQAPRICVCGVIVRAGDECRCQRQRRAAYERSRVSSTQRGYDSRWRKARATFLAKPENHLCKCGCGRTADVVDHVIPHRGDMKLFWDTSNWQPLAARCHNSTKQSLERREPQ